MRERAQTARSEETPEARETRLQQMREHAQTARSKETPEAREARLQQMREHVQTVAHQISKLISTAIASNHDNTVADLGGFRRFRLNPPFGWTKY